MMIHAKFEMKNPVLLTECNCECNYVTDITRETNDKTSSIFVSQ